MSSTFSQGDLKSFISSQVLFENSRYFFLRISFPIPTPSLLNALILYSSSTEILNSISDFFKFRSWRVAPQSFRLYEITLSISETGTGFSKSPSYSWTLEYCIVTSSAFKLHLSFFENIIVSKSKCLNKFAYLYLVQESNLSSPDLTIKSLNFLISSVIFQIGILINES